MNIDIGRSRSDPAYRSKELLECTAADLTVGLTRTERSFETDALLVGFMLNGKPLRCEIPWGDGGLNRRWDPAEAAAEVLGLQIARYVVAQNLLRFRRRL